MRVKIQENDAFRRMITKLYDFNSINNLNGLSIDSRKIQKGDIFIPLKGDNVDGHHFIRDALDKGASLVFSEQNNDENQKIIPVRSTLKTLGTIAANWRSTFTGSIIGITGSNGKTTTKDLIAAILSNKFQCTHTEGNLNSTIGLPLSLISMSTDKDKYILEMGSGSPGEIRYLCELSQPEVGLITNITEAHIQYFDTVENILLEKSALFNSLPENGTAFLNLDDPYLSKLTPSCNTITYSFNSDSDFHGKYSINSDKVRVLEVNGIEIKVPYGGAEMAQNILGAFSVSSYLGIEDSLIIDAVESFNAPSGRGQLFHYKEYTIIDDTYNANPASVKAGIDQLSNIPKAVRRIAIIGDMLELGEESENHHSALGEYISEKRIDAVFGYGYLTKFMTDTLNKLGVESRHFTDQLELTHQLEQFIQPGDILYFKGSRSMQMENIIKELFTD